MAAMVQVSRTPCGAFEVARNVAWRRRSAQAGNRGVGSWWFSGVYGDLRGAGALYLAGQDAFARLVRSV